MTDKKSLITGLWKEFCCLFEFSHGLEDMGKEQSIYQISMYKTTTHSPIYEYLWRTLSLVVICPFLRSLDGFNRLNRSNRWPFQLILTNTHKMTTKCIWLQRTQCFWNHYFRSKTMRIIVGYELVRPMLSNSKLDISLLNRLSDNLFGNFNNFCPKTQSLLQICDSFRFQ